MRQAQGMEQNQICVVCRIYLVWNSARPKSYWKNWSHNFKHWAQSKVAYGSITTNVNMELVLPLQ